MYLKSMYDNRLVSVYAFFLEVSFDRADKEFDFEGKKLKYNPDTPNYILRGQTVSIPIPIKKYSHNQLVNAYEDMLELRILSLYEMKYTKERERIISEENELKASGKKITLEAKEHRDSEKFKLELLLSGIIKRVNEITSIKKTN